MDKLDIIKRIKKDVSYRDLGGSEFRIEKEIDKDDLIYKACFEGNWACKNYLERRKDVNINFPYKFYYGKVGALGYVFSEDELEEI